MSHFWGFFRFLKSSQKHCPHPHFKLLVFLEEYTQKLSNFLMCSLECEKYQTSTGTLWNSTTVTTLYSEIFIVSTDIWLWKKEKHEVNSESEKPIWPVLWIDIDRISRNRLKVLSRRCWTVVNLRKKKLQDEFGLFGLFLAWHLCKRNLWSVGLDKHPD